MQCGCPQYKKSVELLRTKPNHLAVGLIIIAIFINRLYMQQTGKKILIIEEDIEILTLIYTRLLPMDFMLEATLEVSEMKARLERFQPDLLLISSNLAHEGEMQILSKAHQQMDTQIIIIGKIDEVAIPLYSQHFIADFLIKPFDDAQLLIKINNLLPA